MKHKLIMVIGIVAIGLVAAWTAGVDRAQAPPEASAPSLGEQAAAPEAAATGSADASLRDTGEAAAAGYRVAIDPVSGAFVERVPSDDDVNAADPSLRSARSSDEGYIEVDGAAGGKGIKVGDRFQSTFVVTVSDDGEVRSHCSTDEGSD
jgi:hypothetical protein